MNETESNQVVLAEAKTPEPVTTNHEKLDAKQLRVEHIAKILEQAYLKPSLKLKPDEVKKLREDFPDEAIEIRPHDGIIYLSHMALRERLLDVFGPGQVREIV